MSDITNTNTPETGVNTPNPKARKPKVNKNKTKQKPSSVKSKKKSTSKKPVPTMKAAISYDIHHNDDGGILVLKRGTRITTLSGKSDVHWDPDEIIRISKITNIFTRNLYHRLVMLIDANKNRTQFVTSNEPTTSHSVESLIYKFLVDNSGVLHTKDTEVTSDYDVKPSTLKSES